MTEFLPIGLDAVEFVGSRLARPECVLCTGAGDVFAADRRGGVSHITPDGAQRIYAGATLDLSGPLLTNGIALDRDGSFLVTHLAEGEGVVLVSTGSIPEDVPDRLQTLLAQHLRETGEAVPLDLLQGFEVLRHVFHRSTVLPSPTGSRPHRARRHILRGSLRPA